MQNNSNSFSYTIVLSKLDVANNNVNNEYTIDEAKKAIEKITGDGSVTISNDKDGNLEIKDSFKIKNRYQRILVSKILKNTIDNGKKLTTRSAYSLAAEWEGHNVMYKFGCVTKNEELIKRTKDVNLDYKFFTNECDTIIGTIILEIIGCL